MIDMQRMVKDLKKIAEETNMTITEMEEMILMASINNRMVNTMNITQISEDLRYVVQSDMDERALQIQRMLADELDQYKGMGNKYMEENIQEIQELYMDKEKEKEKGKGKVEDKEIILIKPYKVSTATISSTSQTSFITEEVENLSKYMKFVQTPTQTRIFRPPPHYQSLKFRGEQDPIFWKEVATAFVEMKHNTNTSRNGYQIKIFQGGPLHEPYFITIDNMEQIIIGPSKKIVATHVIGELAVMV